MLPYCRPGGKVLANLEGRDAEEEALALAIEAPDYVLGKSALTPARLTELQEAASRTIADERTKISLRITKSDLARIKAKALEEGLSYQTLINSILHKAVSK